MSSGAIFWLVIFAVSVATFFVVAGVVAVKGFGDLLDLLRVSEPASERDGAKKD